MHFAQKVDPPEVAPLVNRYLEITTKNRTVEILKEAYFSKFDPPEAAPLLIHYLKLTKNSYSH